MPFAWSVHPSIPTGLAVLTAAYALAVGPLRRRLGAPRVPPERIVAFATGVLILFLTLTGPIHDLSDSYLFSVHMVQHLILTLIVPPLLLVATPAWVVRRVLAPEPLQRLAKVLGSAPAAFCIFTGTLAVWHLPSLYNSTLMRLDVHVFEHLLFIVAATVGWWPVLAPAHEYRASILVQMLYLLLIPLPMKAVGLMITLADQVLYPAYAIAPRVWGLDPLSDQQIGGLIMWVPAGFVFWIAFGAHFFRWFAESRRQDSGETNVIPLARERVT